MKKYIQPETKEIQLHLGAALLEPSLQGEVPINDKDHPIGFSPRHNSILWEDDDEEEEM